MKKITAKYVSHNAMLQYYYPLGQIHSAWTLIDNLYAEGDGRQKALVSGVLGALTRLDDYIRDQRYPVNGRVTKVKKAKK